MNVKCCVDYASPFTTKITRRVSSKRYLCLFTCSATRVVHLEMACSLSTTDFLNAFSQMVATRGRPEEVTSDYGTNFVEAERELRELIQAMDQEQIAGNVANNGLRWNWNPLLGSHFGGVFESLVKVAKKTLKVVVGNAGLTDDELQTAIKEVEALMNSRPLTYEGADPRDEPVLTPNHFKRCRPVRVHALERRAEDLETLFGGGGGKNEHAIVCLFVFFVSARRTPV